MMGIYLSRLVDNSTDISGKKRYDLLPMGYNIGWFAFKSKRPELLAKNTNQVIDSTNVTTGNYILKLVGKNGLMETILRG